MNNLGTIEKLIEELSNGISSNEKLFFALSVFISLNILLTIVNIIVQFMLKNKEKNINGHNQRETKRIEKQSSLYKMLECLSYYDGYSDSQVYQDKVSEINMFLTRERLFLSKDLIKLSQEYTDYFLGILSDYRTKSYEKEIEILDNFCNKFNNGKH